jgi:hypothetical protein
MPFPKEEDYFYVYSCLFSRFSITFPFFSFHLLCPKLFALRSYPTHA